MNTKDNLKEATPETSATVVEKTRRFAVPRFSKKVLLLMGAVLVTVILGVAAYVTNIKSQTSKTNKDAPKSSADTNGRAQLDEIIVNATIPATATKNERSIHEQNLASVYLERGEKTTAFAHYKKALEHTPTDSIVTYEAAELAEQLKLPEAAALYKKAFNLYRQEIDANPGEYPPASYHMAAQLAVKAGDIPAAKTYYQKTIESVRLLPPSEESKAYQDSAQKELGQL